MALKTLLAHNYYQQGGGEDMAYAAEADLLSRAGNTVIKYVEDNRRIDAMHKADVAIQTLWSQTSYRKISEPIKKKNQSSLTSIIHFRLSRHLRTIPVEMQIFRLSGDFTTTD